jgi:hypothetical protein
MTDFRRGAIRPMECFSQGWAIIKDQFWLFVGITLVAILIMQLLPLILMGPMMCGLYMCLFHKMRGEQVEFAHLFKGFDLFVPGLLVGLIQVAPVLIVTMLVAVPSVAALIAMAPEPARRGVPAPPPEPLFFVVIAVMVLSIMIVAMAASMMFIFSFPLLVERQMAPMEAIKTSVRAVLGNLGGVLGLLLLNFAGSLVGFMLCYVGAFMFMPVAFAAYTVAYRQVFPEPYAPSYAPPAPPQWGR